MPSDLLIRNVCLDAVVSRSNRQGQCHNAQPGPPKLRDWSESAVGLPPRSDLLSASRTLILLCFFAFPIAPPAIGQTCDSSPIAFDDEAFHEGELIVIDVLANDVEPDGEVLTVTMVTNVSCNGVVSEDLGLVSFEPAAPSSQACTLSYQVVDEQENSASAIVFIRDTHLIFKDGFESGDTSAWGEEVTK